MRVDDDTENMSQIVEGDAVVEVSRAIRTLVPTVIIVGSSTRSSSCEAHGLVLFPG